MNNIHPGYFTDTHSGQPFHRCLNCQYDSFLQENIVQHVKFNHPPIELPTETVNRIAGKRVAITFLTWNTDSASVFGLSRLLAEVRRLKGLGVTARVFWRDNGSTDNTVVDLKQMTTTDVEFNVHSTNLGQTYARNLLLEDAARWGYDYLLMVDGDIEVIPNSTFAMANSISRLGKNVGCLGMYCRNCTDNANDPDLSRDCVDIPSWMLRPEPQIAWTNYGIFTRKCLQSVKFDENDVFMGEGWGFEDDDLYLQMVEAGFTAVNTQYYRHLHRKRHSSLRLMDKSLAAKVFNKRKRYLLDKWKSSTNPEIQWRLTLIENQTLPVV